MKNIQDILEVMPHRYPILLIDRVLEMSEKTIRAIKNVTFNEPHFLGHFPGHPVMPGVLMLEAMTQASAWLIRASEDFAHSMVVLRQAANVKYGHFVEPGHTLCVTAEILSQTENLTKLKAQGIVDGQTSVSARLVLDRYNLAQRHPARREADEAVRARMREIFALLWTPEGERREQGGEPA